jgi:hypothetical protein
VVFLPVGASHIDLLRKEMVQMFAMKKTWLVITALGVAALLSANVNRTAADFELGQDFDLNDTVETLTVRITVGESGEDLSEPIALDLGLGFPFWLHPVGRVPGDVAPFGALAQQTDAEDTVSAGSTVEFSFSLAGEEGQDFLQTSSQLLAGVRVSDISRIGFMSRGESNWILAGYEIEINGRSFASDDDVDASAADTQAAASARLGEISLEIAPIEAEADNIRLLIDAGVAPDNAEARLQEIDEQLLPLAQERTRLERQLAGGYPWFEEPSFDSPWRSGEPVQEVLVSVVTASHTGADTQNYVYYRTGGHKYLLSSPMNPMSAENGMRVFPLDLVGGPLTPGDMRGHALGMLAHAEPYAVAPDRWHPERLVVEVDGRVVYDSDEKQLDNASLQAIRIIPPSHFDETGALVENEPVERETYVWEAGEGQGLDLATGEAEELPDPDDEAFPEPEPGTPFEEELYTDAEYYDGFDPGYDPFPGEEYYEEWYYYDDYYYDDPYGGGVGWLDIVVTPWGDLAGVVEEILDLITGDPDGDPIQVQDVRFVNTGGWGGGWDIEWSVHGDDSEVTGYHVEVVVIQPHEAMPVAGSVAIGDVGPGGRSIAVTPAHLAAALAELGAGDPQLAYLQPWVSPVTAAGDPGFPGASRALTELRWDDIRPINRRNEYVILGTGDIGFLAAPVDGSTAWDPGPCECRGILYDAPLIGSHLILRFDPGDPVGAWAVWTGFVGLDLGVDINRRVVGHVGFMEPFGGVGNAVNIVGDVYDPAVGVPVSFNYAGVANTEAALRSVVMNYFDTGELWFDVRVEDAGTVRGEPVVILGVRVLQP